MSADATDPKYVRYLIALALIDGPELPPGEVEFRIIGTIAAAEPMAHEFEADDEPLRFRVTDWAGPKPYERPAVVVTDRGFKHYEPTITDTDRGEKVRVYESSAADGPYLWLSVEGEAYLDGPGVVFPGIPFGVAPATCAAHLTLDQAREIRDRLDAAIRGHYQIEGECGRMLVCRGPDTLDPCRVLPAGHEGMCKP